jgi:uncharacterized protein YbcI
MATSEDRLQERVTRDGPGAVVAAISRQLVGIYAEYYGRGPTRAKTIWRDDVVVCILEDVFTRAERLLIDGGRFDQVRLNRQAFQEQLEPTFHEVVEKVTGRQVEACLSQVNPTGVAAEIFTLGPPLLSDPA